MNFVQTNVVHTKSMGDVVEIFHKLSTRFIVRNNTAVFVGNDYDKVKCGDDVFFQQTTSKIKQKTGIFVLFMHRSTPVYGIKRKIILCRLKNKNKIAVLKFLFCCESMSATENLNIITTKFGLLFVVFLEPLSFISSKLLNIFIMLVICTEFKKPLSTEWSVSK